MSFWHYVSQAILAHEPLTTSLSATSSISGISTTQSISPSSTSLTISTMATPDDTNNATNTTLYFGYGSNLWLEQMHNRCPNSTYLGIARLKNYKWIINERGYANVVEMSDDEYYNYDDNDNEEGQALTPYDEDATTSAGVTTTMKQNYKWQVWGLVYSLQPSDEARLDSNEGVPVAYTKEMLKCEFWPASGDQDDESSKVVKMTRAKREKKDLLVYINRDAVTPSKPKEEYVYRMNMGIKDAIKEGVPEGYVEEIMRKYIPEVEEVGEVVKVAKG